MRAPSWLNKSAKTYWKHYGKLLEVTESNQDQVALLCSALALYRQSSEALDKEGLITSTATGGAKRHPACDIQKQAFSQIVRVSTLLGLTGKAEPPMEADELDDLLGA